MLHLIAWQMGINILEETAASIFYPESIMSAAIKMTTVYNKEGVTGCGNNISH
jgi:hypothetical protein